MSDVARLAKVSRYTVSKVLNGDGTVKAATREKVMRACRRLSFSPNQNAVNLVRGATNTMGLIVSQVTDTYYGEIMEAADHAARELGWELVFRCSYSEAALEAQIVRHLLALRVRGLIVAPVIGEENRALLLEAERRLPVIYIDRFFNKDCHYVTNDHYQSAHAITAHLLGARPSVAYLGSSKSRFNRSIADRVRGYLDAVSAAGVEPLLIPTEHCAERRDSERFGYDNLRAYLQAHAAPPALFFANDAIALGGMHALESHGLKPGRDVLVAGHDDLSFSAHCSPPLTTVRQPKQAIAREAVKAVIALADGARRKTYIHKLIQSELVIRESSG